MKKEPINNRFLTGFVTGLLLPPVVFVIVYFVSSGEMSFEAYLSRIADANIVTHFISLCVFPNVFAFLLFNRFDKLNSSRGVLGITIIWALTTFLIKML